MTNSPTITPVAPIERTVQITSHHASSMTPVPAGLVNDTRAVSEVVPAVPTATSIVEVAVPAPVLVMLNFQRKIVPTCNLVAGTLILEPVIYVRVAAAGDCDPVEKLDALPRTNPLSSFCFS